MLAMLAMWRCGGITAIQDASDSRWVRTAEPCIIDCAVRQPAAMYQCDVQRMHRVESASGGGLLVLQFSKWFGNESESESGTRMHGWPGRRQRGMPHRQRMRETLGHYASFLLGQPQDSWCSAAMCEYQ